MGVFEMENFAKGTKAIAEAMAAIDATTIIAVSYTHLESVFDEYA